MAIDSAKKRKSISGITIPMIPGVTNNAAKNTFWRSSSGWSYSELVQNTGVLFFIRRIRLKAVVVDGEVLIP